LGLDDVLAVPATGTQPVQFGWVFGRTTFQALFYLSGKIWETFEHHLGGRFSLRELDLQSLPELKRVWWLFARAMQDQLPGSLEGERAGIEVAFEWGAGDAARPEPKETTVPENEGDGAGQLDTRSTTEEQLEGNGADQLDPKETTEELPEGKGAAQPARK